MMVLRQWLEPAYGGVPDIQFESSPGRRQALKFAGFLLPALISTTLMHPAASTFAGCTVNGKAGQCMPVGDHRFGCCALCRSDLRKLRRQALRSE